MRLEDLKKGYPVIPEDIHNMIEREVNNQMNDNIVLIKNRKRHSYMSLKKVAALAVTASLAIGTTAFAGVKLYQWNMDKDGNYGVKSAVVANETVKVPSKIPVLSIETGYLPDGMVAADDGSTKYYNTNTPYEGGISIQPVAMDAELSIDNLPTSDKYVTNSEIMNINELDVIYLEKDTTGDEGISFDKKIYVAYPDYWQILEIFVGDDVSKEDALNVVKNLKVTSTGETSLLSEAYKWSDTVNPEIDETECKTTATSEEMQNLYEIGEEFVIPASSEDSSDVTAKVSDVKILDDYSALDNSFVDKDMKKALDSNGKLAQNEISYIETGDGIDSLDNIVSSEKVNQKLVYVTVDITNTSEQKLKDYLFFGSFIGLKENGGNYTIYNRADADNNDSTDSCLTSSIGGLGEMDYYDIHSGERNNNHISSIKPGETVTVHIAKVVNEDELDCMYFTADPQAGTYEFTESGLATGYVDIRQ